MWCIVGVASFNASSIVGMKQILRAAPEFLTSLGDYSQGLKIEPRELVSVV